MSSPRTTFDGGISNGGKIVAGTKAGILVTSVVAFGNGCAGGGITNTGSIVARNTGIAVFAGTMFAANISNGGTISAGVTA